jgi:hypothetical protein
VVIDDGVRVVIAEVLAFLRCWPGAIAGEGVPGAVEARVGLDVDVQQIAGARPLITVGGFSWRVWLA